MGKIEVIKRGIKEKLDTARDFINEHKLEFITGGAVLLALGGSYMLGKTNGRLAVEQEMLDDEGKDILKALSGAGKTFADGDAETKHKMELVDEQIFTDLAPEIENYVLDNGIDHAVSERSYDIGNNYHKLVKVDVTQVVGD